MIELTLTVRIKSTVCSRIATDTFFLNLSKEDMTEEFIKDFADFAIDPENNWCPQEITGDEIRTQKDEANCYHNALYACHDMLPGNIDDWKVIKTKTKFKETK